MFKWLTGRGVIIANPILGVEKPGVESSRERVLKDDELRALWGSDRSPSRVTTLSIKLSGYCS